MPSPASLAAPAPTPDQAQRRALALAAQAVLAVQVGRPALRLTRVQLRPGAELQLACPPLPEALRGHRPLLEETAMLTLAGDAALQVSDPSHRGPALAAATELLRQSARDEDEAAVAPAYAEVLQARARALLRRAWPQVQVVAAGLLEHGALTGDEVATRLRCVSGVAGRTMN